MKQVQSDDLRVVFVDVFKCKSPIDFAEAVASAVLSQTASKTEEFIENAKTFLGRINFGVNLSPDPVSAFDIKVRLSDEKSGISDALSVPERIAQKKKVRILVCIDEFQQVGEFADSLTVQKRMRSVWQHQQHVNYCLFGSKKHLLQNMFLKSSYPFYKFGDIIPLEPIKEDLWIPYLQQGFRSWGKELPEKIARQICTSVQLHPSYVQQLAWLTLLNTQQVASEETLQLGIDDLINENAALFIQQTEQLTPFQLNFLYAMLDGVDTDFGKENIREQYQLGAYSNIARVKGALVEKELIDTQTRSKVVFADPVFALWLRKNMR